MWPIGIRSGAADSPPRRMCVAIRAQTVGTARVHTCEVLERREQPLRILAEVAERAAACRRVSEPIEYPGRAPLLPAHCAGAPSCGLRAHTHAKYPSTVRSGRPRRAPADVARARRREHDVAAAVRCGDRLGHVAQRAIVPKPAYAVPWYHLRRNVPHGLGDARVIARGGGLSYAA